MNGFLTSPELLVTGIVFGMFVLIVGTSLKIEIIAMLVLLATTVSGLVDPKAAIAGFGSPVVITLMGLFIITSALEQTGVVQWIARRLKNLGGGSEVKLIVVFMTAASLLSLIMNNVAAGAVLLPAAVRVARESRVPAGKLLMPMSFGTLVGGMATYFTTANILMSGLLVNHGFAGLNMHDFLPVGLMIVAAGILYILFIGRRLLPASDTVPETSVSGDLAGTYQLKNRQWHVRVDGHSTLAGKTIAESGINAELGLTVGAVWRKARAIPTPGSDQRILPGDILMLIGGKDAVSTLCGWGNTLLETVRPRRRDLPIEPIEILVAPRSEAQNMTLSEFGLNRDYRILAIAIWRDGKSYTTGVRNMPLQVGDAILVIGKSSDLETLSRNPDFILPEGEYSSRPVDHRKAPLAVAVTAGALGLGITDLLPLPIAMLAGAVLMVLSGALSLSQFYSAISWRVIFLVAGMLPLSAAISDSGLAARIGGAITGALSGSGPEPLLIAMIVFTMLASQLIGGQVSALLVGPVAINAAVQAGMDPRAMAVAVAMSCSMAFLTPIAHPVNILVMGPGKYSFADFARVGTGITITTMAVMLLGLKLFWGI